MSCAYCIVVYRILSHMIVYGEPHYEETFTNLVTHLQSRIALLTEHRSRKLPLEELRTLLIMAGQLEQAADDGLPGNVPHEEAEQQIAHLNAVMAHIANAFYAVWASAYAAQQPDTVHNLNAVHGILGSMKATGDPTLTVKMPEGFAFYALFPEQYCASALRWREEHAGEQEKRVAVVGIRSIGTTLGSVVAATLHAGGWEAVRFTVRPSGHPFERHVEIAQQQIEGATWGLVVDEGPGLSGSSMAAVGEAMTRAGLPRERINFFPGHSGEPGSAASDHVRDWWATTPRYVTSLEQVRFEGRTLPQALVAWLAKMTGDGGDVQITDVGGGRWRELVYDSPAQWPAVCAPFERPKYLCAWPDGRQTLLKFEGLCGTPRGRWTSAELVDRLLQARGQHPIGVHHGFQATNWINGTPLTHFEVAASVLERMGHYIAEVAGPVLSELAQKSGLARLTEMLYWNTWEASGEEMAGRTRAWSEKVTAIPSRPLPWYGDGRMSPHEWIRTPTGAIVKVDSAGHAWDHTCIGTQPVVWDVAGAIVEWRLNNDQIATLLSAFYAAGGDKLPQDALTFYRMAYAAFRMGQCQMCAHMVACDPDEQTRLWTAYMVYRDELGRLLGPGTGG